MSLMLKNASKMRMRVVEFDEPAVRQHPAHLRLEVAPLLRAVEILEHREAALQQVGAKRSASRSVRFQKPGSHMNAIGYLNSSGSSSARIRLPSVRISRSVSSLRMSDRWCSARGIIVVPRGAEAAPAREAEVRLPAQPHEREPAVVGDFG